MRSRRISRNNTHLKRVWRDNYLRETQIFRLEIHEKMSPSLENYSFENKSVSCPVRIPFQNAMTAEKAMNRGQVSLCVSGGVTLLKESVIISKEKKSRKGEKEKVTICSRVLPAFQEGRDVYRNVGSVSKRNSRRRDDINRLSVDKRDVS